MKRNLILAAAAIAALTAGAAAAQTTAAPGAAGTGMSNAPTTTAQPTATNAGENAMPASAAVNNPNVVLMSSPTPPEEAYKLKAGDPNVVTNGPIPDTPQNRAQYGAPMSNAGRHTKPAGD